MFFRINLASIYFVFSTFLVTIISAIAVIICSFIPFLSKIKKQDIMHKISRNWGSMLTLLVFPKFNITGIENYDANKTYIITSNHQSSFDIFFTFYLLKGKYCFISKDVYFKYPLIGHAMKKSGYILVKRSTTSAVKMIDDATDRLQNERSVVIYPEGSRSVDGNVRFPKRGLIKIAEQCPDIEILPVVMDGTRDVMKISTLKVYLGKKINVKFLKPFKMSDIQGDEKEKLKYWYNMMTDELNNMRQ